jgi:hypothetical protein
MNKDGISGGGMPRVGRVSAWVRSFTALTASAMSALLGACHSFGPVGVDPPDRSFAGLDAIVRDLPEGGTLDVFLVHGMRADQTQTYAAVIAAVSARLQLTETAPDPSNQHPTPLVAKPPTVTLDGVAVFDSSNWQSYRPQVWIARYQTKEGRHVNFYRFEYWQALAYMKCKFIVSPDTRVVGASDRSRYCNGKPYEEPTGQRLSSSSDYGNRWLKTEIMEWGLSDATIATSAYRTVLRQAVREMLAIAYREGRTQDGLAADPDVSTAEAAQAELERFSRSGRTRFAFISESLGSYVIHDALTQALLHTIGAEAERSALEPDERPRRAQAIAPLVVVCGASQVHMFANQLALLRFSELNVASPNEVLSSQSVSGASDAHVQDDIPGQSRSHFFRGCPPSPSATESSAGAGRFAAQQVVAYHEPDDLLTYYTSDRPGTTGVGNWNTTNVVVPYTTQWIWWLAADPAEAHTGQPTQPVIMDMVVCGREPAAKPKCPAKNGP